MEKDERLPSSSALRQTWHSNIADKIAGKKNLKNSFKD
jgi:hypothetical protein